VIVVRPFVASDAPQVAALHAELLADSFLGGLGHPFLTKLYRFMAADETFRGWVAASNDAPNGALVGYVVATLDASGFYGRIYRRHFVPLASSVLVRALSRPSIALEALGVLTGGAPEDRPAGDRAELLSIAVRPSARKDGVGRKLVGSLASAIRESGGTTCSVVVAAGIPAHEFYRSIGFVERTTFALHGELCSLYLLDVTASE
jgi:ribosomal protein S18 acetylase RimI-like enzyme